MASSTAATLSWASSWIQNLSLTKNMNQTTKVSDNGSVLLIVAQKKAKKTRKVIRELDPPIFFVFDFTFPAHFYMPGL